MKRKSLFCFLPLIFLILSQAYCASMKGIDYKSAAKLGTPENSVVFYGGATHAQSFSFSQRDSKFPADNQALTDCTEIFVSAPVPPGSTYSLSHFSGRKPTLRAVLVWGELYPLNYTHFDFVMPKKPGLYYLGYWDGVETAKAGEVVKKDEIEKNDILMKTDAEKESYILKTVLKVYKKTAWEPVIRERIKELEK